MKYKSLIIFNGALLLFLIIMLYIHPIDVLREYGINNYPSAYDYNGSVEIYGDAYIRQVFTAFDYSDCMNIRMDAVNENYYGSFTVRLYNGNGIVINKWNIDKLDIEDGWAECKIKKNYILPGQLYVIEVTGPELTEQNAIKLWLGSSACKAEGVGALVFKKAWERIEKKYTDYSMSFGTYKRRTNVLGIISLVIVFITANTWFVLKDRGIEFIAFPVLMGMGIMMLVVYPFGAGTYEKNNFYSAYELSNVIMGNENIGIIENKHIIEDSLFRNGSYNEQYIRVINEFHKGHPADEGVKDDLDSIFNTYKSVSYLTPALGVTLGRLFNVNIFKIYELARLLNMLLYVLMIMIAVNLIPVNKELMFMIGLNPMVMRIAASTGYDALAIGLSYVLFAYIIMIMHLGEQVKWSYIIICVGLIILISPIKEICLAFSLIILVVSGKQFASLTDRMLKFLTVIIVGVISVWINYRHSVLDATVSGMGSEYTFRFVAEHPMRFIVLLLHNIEKTLDFSLYGIFGGDVNVPKYMVVVFILLILLCSFSTENTVILTRWSRWLMRCMAIVGYLTVFFVIMIKETVYGGDVIAGWQTRYLISFIPPVMYSLCGYKGNLRLNRMSLFIPIWYMEIMVVVEAFQHMNY